jgi:sensor histidine kinase regulating citrate/malate metabolism
MLKQTLSQLEELNITLRSQRHDFMNHLQVVYSLIELEEFMDTKDYIEKVYNDIQKVSRVMRTSNPALNALLQVKVLACEKRGIEIKLNINSKYDKIKIPSWEFCRILGNLLDNAIQALEEKDGDRIITVELQDNLREFSVHIGDNGSMIPGNLLEKIFQPGFTTKKEHGEGMGLAIAKETTEQYGGIISVRSTEGSTVFTVSIPKTTQSLNPSGKQS